MYAIRSYYERKKLQNIKTSPMYSTRNLITMPMPCRMIRILLINGIFRVSRLEEYRQKKPGIYRPELIQIPNVISFDCASHGEKLVASRSVDGSFNNVYISTIDLRTTEEVVLVRNDARNLGPVFALV